MKKLFIVLSITLLTTCASFAQNCVWKQDDVSNQRIPVGVCTWDDLQNGDFASSMRTFYDHYNPNWMYLSDLKRIMQERFSDYKLHFYVYFGGWSNDCLETVPYFVRYAEMLAETYQEVMTYDLVAVDRNLKTGNALLDGRQLTAAPTIFIVFKPVGGGAEIPVGTVSGIPQESLESDIYMQLAHYYKMHQ